MRWHEQGEEVVLGISGMGILMPKYQALEVWRHKKCSISLKLRKCISIIQSHCLLEGKYLNAYRNGTNGTTYIGSRPWFHKMIMISLVLMLLLVTANTEVHIRWARVSQSTWHTVNSCWPFRNFLAQVLWWPTFHRWRHWSTEINSSQSHTWLAA